MQMQSVETSAGTAICAAPSRMAWCRSWPSSMKRSMFSMVTVASSTRMPTASARPPSVMMLMVSCRKLSTITEVRMESGIETAMIRVLRQLPRKTRIMSPVRHGGDHRFADDAADGRAHEDGLIRQRLDLQLPAAAWRRSRAAACGRLPPPQSVEALPALSTRQQRGAAAVLPHDVGLRREAVAHVGHVADVNGRAVHHLDRKIVELLHPARAGVQIHVVFELADLGGPGRDDEVLRADGVDHVRGRKAPRLHRRPGPGRP